MKGKLGLAKKFILNHPLKVFILSALFLANLATYLVFFDKQYLHQKQSQVLGTSAFDIIKNRPKITPPPGGSSPPTSTPRPTRTPRPTSTPRPSPTPRPIVKFELQKDVLPLSQTGATPILINDNHRVRMSPPYDSSGQAREYVGGFEVRPVSKLTYDVKRLCTNFQADIGLNDSANPPSGGTPRGSVYFNVYGDGRQLYHSPVMTSASSTISLVNNPISTAGIRQLTLEVISSDSQTAYDYAVWAKARVNCRGDFLTATPAPTTTPSPGPTVRPIDQTSFNKGHQDIYTVSLEYDPTTQVITELNNKVVKGHLEKLLKKQPVQTSSNFVYKIRVVSKDRLLLQEGWNTLDISTVKNNNNKYEFVVSTIYQPGSIISLYLPNGGVIWSGIII